MRKSLTFSTEKHPLFESRLLRWSNKFSALCYLNSNSIANSQNLNKQNSNYRYLLAVDSIQTLTVNFGNAFQELKEFKENCNDWLFGYLGYDLKNEIEKLQSQNQDSLGFADMQFFQPKLLFLGSENAVNIQYFEHHFSDSDIQSIVEEIEKTDIASTKAFEESPEIFARESKESYQSKIEKIKQHIYRGDIYELNFCIEFYAEAEIKDTLSLYLKLNEISEAPLSGFYKMNELHLICSSPERFLMKKNEKILSQPIKGTRKRSLFKLEDEALKIELKYDSKEQSENVMIVDLVRNDLSKTAKKGSVKVEELMAVYSFKQVHQLISSISCELKESCHFLDAIKGAFPMGSMTGAPKIRAMELIEQYELTKRGLYSGALGYITPDSDFDFNVVIRSILYNQKKKYLSFMVGSAITVNSITDKEYEECLLKANAMFQVLQ